MDLSNFLSIENTMVIEEFEEFLASFGILRVWQLNPELRQLDKNKYSLDDYTEKLSKLSDRLKRECMNEITDKQYFTKNSDLELELLQDVAALYLMLADYIERLQSFRTEGSNSAYHLLATREVVDGRTSRLIVELLEKRNAKLTSSLLFEEISRLISTASSLSLHLDDALLLARGQTISERISYFITTMELQASVRILSAYLLVAVAINSLDS